MYNKNETKLHLNNVERSALHKKQRKKKQLLNITVCDVSSYLHCRPR